MTRFLCIAVAALFALSACKDDEAPARSDCSDSQCPHPHHAQRGPGGDPLRGFDLERLERVSEGMRRHVEAGRLSGVVALVARDGQIVHRTVIGNRDREAGLPMQEDTLFRIYSMSKPITSVATLILVEEGRLRLTDPVDRWLPELANPRVLQTPDGPLDEARPAKGPITVRDLLTHTSGLAYTFTSQGPLSRALQERGVVGSSSELDPDEWMKRLGELPLMLDPGTHWHYGLSTDVLGVLVARVSGMSFPEFLESRIFEPLGMKDTGFYVPAEKLERLAVNYAPDPENGTLIVEDHPRDSRYARPPIFPSGGGGLVSTAHDYLRFARMMTRGGALDGVRILSPKGVALMTSNALWPSERPAPPFGSRFFLTGSGFGLGVSVLEEPGIAAQFGSKGLNGWGGAASTSYWSDPAEGISAVLMVQLMNQGANPAFGRDFQTLVYQALERPRTRSPGGGGRHRKRHAAH